MASDEPSRPGQTASNLNPDHDETPPATGAVKLETSRSKQSLQHILTSEPSGSSKGGEQKQATPAKSPNADTPTKQSIVWVDGNLENPEDAASTQNDSYTRSAEFNPSYTMTVAHTRRNANGTIGSVYSGNKIRHLKKEDGIPLWRKDIQLEFLRCVFEDKTPVFTKASDGKKNCTFVEIYVDSMARSTKTSKVLKEKMLADPEGAMSMAMICLLVNVGRMNTTLNFFPEMRAQLRTYHAIPSLQAHSDPNSYKQLQDAPRLKSILKGASEDTDQPNTIDKIKAAPIPRTNPVNLIFVLSQYAPKISETHFNAPRDFFDLVMRGTLSSKSRAKAFLWLIWWYLESDFTEEAALNNPFGPGQHGDQTGGLPLKVPAFDHLTEEQANAENVDTEEEIEYGRMKQRERRRILEEDETVGPPLKRSRKSNGEAAIVNVSDTERTRSPSPSSTRRQRGGDRSRSSILASRKAHERSPAAPRYQPLQSKAEQNNPPRLALKSKGDAVSGSSPPAPPGSSHPILSSGVSNGYRRPRPETSHQRAVNINRKMRIDHILHKRLTKEQRKIRREKRKLISSFGMQAMNRIHECPEMYDSEGDASTGPGGLTSGLNEMEEYGEEALRHKKGIERALRRLFREDHTLSVPGGVIKVEQKRKRKQREIVDMEEIPPVRKRRKGQPRHPRRARTSARKGGVEPPEEDGLDDLDLDLLGENRAGAKSEAESGGEGTELQDGDVTEDDVAPEA